MAEDEVTPDGPTVERQVAELLGGVLGETGHRLGIAEVQYLADSGAAGDQAIMVVFRSGRQVRVTVAEAD